MSDTCLDPNYNNLHWICQKVYLPKTQYQGTLTCKNFVNFLPKKNKIKGEEKKKKEEGREEEEKEEEGRRGGRGRKKKKKKKKKRGISTKPKEEGWVQQSHKETYQETQKKNKRDLVLKFGRSRRSWSGRNRWVGWLDKPCCCWWCKEEVGDDGCWNQQQQLPPVDTHAWSSWFSRPWVLVPCKTPASSSYPPAVTADGCWSRPCPCQSLSSSRLPLPCWSASPSGTSGLANWRSTTPSLPSWLSLQHKHTNTPTHQSISSPSSVCYSSWSYPPPWLQQNPSVRVVLCSVSVPGRSQGSHLLRSTSAMACPEKLLLLCTFLAR